MKQERGRKESPVVLGTLMMGFRYDRRSVCEFNNVRRVYHLRVDVLTRTSLTRKSGLTSRKDKTYDH